MRMRSLGVVSVASILSAAGAFTLARPAMAQPANDTCEMATPLVINGSVTGTNLNANIDIFSVPCTDDLDSFDVWYSLGAPVAGMFVIDTVGSQLDTTLAVFALCPASNLLACNDDIAPGNTDSIVTVTLDANQVVFVRIGGYGLTEGPFVVNVTGPDGGGDGGVCCRGTTCVVGLTAQECTGPNTQYLELAPECNATDVLTTPCCKADFNKVNGVEVQDIFDFLNAWFNLGC